MPTIRSGLGSYKTPPRLPNIDYDKLFMVDFGINSSIPYERASIERCKDLFQGATIIDIGAHYGLWSLAALQGGASRVIAFECSHEDIGVLSNNLKEFPEYNYMIVERYVDDKAGSIDSWLSEFPPNLIRPTFMKIDVEGGELNVLKGAEKTIKKHRPSMMIEAHELYVPGIKDEVIELLYDWISLEPISYQFCCKGLYHLYYDLREIELV